ncbi:MAG: hypothetical protein EON59_12190 [Alphaproteobacteria bacterium]|nr:MAG: hypothetical protein EON59_12190 [Alphaproteobacteria bacterium]
MSRSDGIVVAAEQPDTADILALLAERDAHFDRLDADEDRKPGKNFIWSQGQRSPCSTSAASASPTAIKIWRSSSAQPSATTTTSMPPPCCASTTPSPKSTRGRASSIGCWTSSFDSRPTALQTVAVGAVP